MQLAGDIKSNKNPFYKYFRRKKKTKVSVGPLVNVDENQIMDDVEDSKVFYAFLLQPS